MLRVRGGAVCALVERPPGGPQPIDAVPVHRLVPHVAVLGHAHHAAQRSVHGPPVVIHNVPALVHLLDPLRVAVEERPPLARATRCKRVGRRPPLDARRAYPELAILHRRPLALEGLRLVAVAIRDRPSRPRRTCREVDLIEDAGAIAHAEQPAAVLHELRQLHAAIVVCRVCFKDCVPAPGHIPRVATDVAQQLRALQDRVPGVWLAGRGTRFIQVRDDAHAILLCIEDEAVNVDVSSSR